MQIKFSFRFDTVTLLRCIKHLRKYDTYGYDWFHTISTSVPDPTFPERLRPEIGSPWIRKALRAFLNLPSIDLSGGNTYSGVVADLAWTLPILVASSVETVSSWSMEDTQSKPARSALSTVPAHDGLAMATLLHHVLVDLSNQQSHMMFLLKCYAGPRRD